MSNTPRPKPTPYIKMLRKATSLKNKQLRQENAKWPDTLAEVPEKDWPAQTSQSGLENKRTRVWRSKTFLVQEFAWTGGIVWLAVCRTEIDSGTHQWKDGIVWDELQRLKFEAGYGDRDAVEILPAQNDLVNVANLRHIWVLPEKITWKWTKDTLMTKGENND